MSFCKVCKLANSNHVAKELNVLLADEYVLYTKLHNFHWNVKGPLFDNLHKMFQDHYTQIGDFIDILAERIQALNFTPTSTLQGFLELTRLEEAPEYLGWEDMVQISLRDHQFISGKISDLFKIATSFNDDGTGDIILGFQAEHDKMAWMLKSILDSKTNPMAKDGQPFNSSCDLVIDIQAKKKYAEDLRELNIDSSDIERLKDVGALSLHGFLSSLKPLSQREFNRVIGVSGIKSLTDFRYAYETENNLDEIRADIVLCSSSSGVASWIKSLVDISFLSSKKLKDVLVEGNKYSVFLVLYEDLYRSVPRFRTILDRSKDNKVI